MAEDAELRRPLSRRDFGKLSLAGLPMSLAFQAIGSKIEYEFPGTDAVAEVAKCFQFRKDALA